MKIIIFGAAGDVGRRVVDEALSRNHTIQAVVRQKEQLESFPKGVEAILGNVESLQEIENIVAKQDHIISAIRPALGLERVLPELTQNLLELVGKVGKKIHIVGGAARLKLPNGNGETVLTAPGFLPESVKEIARACFEQYEICVENSVTNWVYVTPSAMLLPGEKTNIYRLGKDELIMDEDGNSSISMEDFAVAILNDVENAKDYQRSFTVGY